MNKHYNLAILGGGCAGLSLAMRLAEAGLTTPSTLVLEKNANYTNDRTWCFWDEENPELKNWADHSWLNFEIKNGIKTFTKNCRNNAYLMLSAQTFYERSLAKIAENKQGVTMLTNQDILEVTKIHNQTWRIITATGIYTADKVVDTRPNKQIKDEDSLLWQSFIGFEVEASRDTFDAHTFVLMDFDTTFSEGLGFVYVIPYSANRALIEYTIFAGQSFTNNQLREYIKPALLKYLKDIEYKILRTEYGKLPMGNKKINKTNDPSYIYAGLYAGAARPSSGYAFQRIQRWAKNCAHALISHQLLTAPEKDPWILASMDDFFLNVLKSNPQFSIALFYNFFLRCETPTVIRFLSDHASILDYLFIIASMPKLLFLKELPTYIFNKLFKLQHD
jgi:lycopene beta-cyclase